MTGIRSDVVGSLLRPPYLVEAREALAAGRLAAAEFKRVEDRAVDEAVRLQESAGLDAVTDGELRRYAFFGHLVEALEGFDKFGGWAIPFHDEAGGELVFKRPVVVGRLAWRRSLCGEEFVYLRARTTRTAKVTLISAQQAAAYYDPRQSTAAYPTRDAYLADVVDFTRREIEELVRLGCTYVQIDAPQYAALLDPALREGYRQRGSDPDRLIDACIEMDNAAIGRHPGVTFALHICRGNNQSMFYASGGYAPIARVFGRTRFQRFLLEYDD
jgi:5-methyltetrahydropteroyltriglutamate--homocysteine methyltransferase